MGTETVDIEYVGDPELLDETTRLRIAMGEIPKSSADILRGASAHRHVPLKGVTRRIVDPEHFNVSRTYVFGPNTFRCAVKSEDVDGIMSSSSAHQFRIVGDPINDLILPPKNMTLVDELTIREGQSFTISRR